MKNNAIALFVGILIVVMLVGILVGPERVAQITGYSASASTASFNLSEEVSVSVTSSVNFGSGRVYANASQAILDSSLGYFYQHNWTNITNSEGDIMSERFPIIAYDSVNDVFITYGYFLNHYGDSPSNGFETWQYNYSSRNWTNLTPAHHPNAFDNLRMVYDPSVQAIILFGGYNGTNLNETWKFNSSRDWEKLNPAKIPPASASFAMVFDSNRNVSVIHSGTIGTWEYNASANNWTNKTTSPQPSGNYYTAMAFDSDRNVTVLFAPFGATYYNETWEYNGTNWVNVTASIGRAPPIGNYGLCMVYDPIRKKIVLVGGDILISPFLSNKVWEYNGTGWANVSLLFMPQHSAAAFDTKINKTIITHGIIGSGPLIEIKDTFEYEAIDEDFNPNASINGSWYFQRGFINVENDGTVNISVNYSASKDAGQFIGGTNPLFMLRGVVEESNACPDLNVTYSEVSNSSSKVVCPLLQYSQDRDIFKVPIKLVIPANAPAGKRNSTITFTAIQVS